MQKLTQKDHKTVIIGSGNFFLTRLRFVRSYVLIPSLIFQGPCGYACAQTLREEGYEGRIILVTADSYLPYDRTKLTKKLGCTWDEIKIREQTFFDVNLIKLNLNLTVTNYVTLYFLYRTTKLRSF